MYESYIVDVNNVAHILHGRYKNNDFVKVNNKNVYIELFKEFISFIDDTCDGSITTPIYFCFEGFTNKGATKNPEYKDYSEYKNILNIRKKLESSYKANRDHKNESLQTFYNTINLIKYYYSVSASKYKIVTVANLEADDVAEAVLKYSCKDDSKTLLISNDLDWAKYINDKVDIYNLEEYINVEKFQNKYGYYPTEEAIIFNKIVYGDKSDNLGSCFIGFDSKKKEKIFSSFKSTENFINDYFKSPLFDLKDKEIIAENIPKIKRYYSIYKSLPLTEGHYFSILCLGRNVQKMRETILSLCDRNKTATFKFSKLKIPRI